MTDSSKKMSLMGLTTLVTVNMMGSGIIMLPTNMAQLGAVSLLSWAFTAIGSMAIAYCFAHCSGLFVVCLVCVRHGSIVWWVAGACLWLSAVRVSRQAVCLLAGVTAALPTCFDIAGFSPNHQTACRSSR